MRWRLWFLPRSLVDFFEASPYGVSADGGNSSSTAVAVPLSRCGSVTLGL
ncbi:MAG: hypothetical protein IIY01_04320 [Clostridia bacterium]|nr:hypothetical protein [Clostridia bacterium]